jgi:hypothetical protein
MLEIFAVEDRAAGFQGGGDDQRIAPGELSAFAMKQGRDEKPNRSRTAMPSQREG